MIRSTPHAHTDFVHGKSSVDQMVLSAIERGFSSLGFSEHGAQPFDPQYCLNGPTERMYKLEIEWVRKYYADKIRIYLGIERDLHSTADRADYQYVIGSAHYMQLDDAYIAVDGPSEHVVSLIHKAFGGDGYKFASAYFDMLARYVESYKPDIIGHVDLIRKPNRDAEFFDVSDARYLTEALEALDRMAPSGAMLEVNTGAMARGYLSTPYPDFTLLKHWQAIGGRVILSSDCHEAALIDYGLDIAGDLVREAGFRSIWALNPSADGDVFVEFEL